MAYKDFIKYINESTKKNYSYEDLQSMVDRGIDWCEHGEHEDDGTETHVCSVCKHYKGCEVIADYIEDRMSDSL